MLGPDTPCRHANERAPWLCRDVTKSPRSCRALLGALSRTVCDERDDKNLFQRARHRGADSSVLASKGDHAMAACGANHALVTPSKSGARYLARLSLLCATIGPHGADWQERTRKEFCLKQTRVRGRTAGRRATYLAHLLVHFICLNKKVNEIFSLTFIFSGAP